MTFEELKREAQKATGRDRLGATAVSLIAEICNNKAEINEARTAVMMAHQVSQHAQLRLRLGIGVSIAMNLVAMALLVVQSYSGGAP